MKQGNTTIKEGCDTAANKTDFSVKLHYHGGNQQQWYTIKLYNTTSRAMVNGMNHKCFLKELDGKVNKMQYLPLSIMDESLRLQLQEALSALLIPGLTTLDQSNTIPTSGSARCSSRCLKKLKPYDPDDDNTKSSPKLLECLLCHSPVQNNEEGWECNECMAWIHDLCNRQQPAT